MFPTVIVTTASTKKKSAHSSPSDGKPTTKIRRSMANDAAFDPTDRNAVTGVGAPSYTSGAHIWNGTAAILNPMPAPTRITASTSIIVESCPLNAAAMPARLVVPVAP